MQIGSHDIRILFTFFNLKPDRRSFNHFSFVFFSFFHATSTRVYFDLANEMFTEKSNFLSPLFIIYCEKWKDSDLEFPPIENMTTIFCGRTVLQERKN